MKQAIIYCRFSPRPDALECTSNERQEERCVEYCLKKEYPVVGLFTDRAISGKTLSRKGLNKALESLKPGMVLVVDTSDRLARDILVNLTIRSQVSSAGCTIEFADGTPLSNTAEGELFQNLMAAFAQYERRRYSNRTKAGMARKKDNGVWCGRPPYGWNKVKGQDKLLPNDDEQQILGEMRVLADMGCCATSIAMKLNGKHCYRRGKPWSPRTILRILTTKRDYP